MAKSFLALFQELGVRFSTTEGQNVTAFCPLHDDRTSSFSVDLDRGLFKCFVSSCRGFDGGNFQQLHKLIRGLPYSGVLPGESISPEEVDQWHLKLLRDKDLLRWLSEARGLTLETIKLRKLGYDGERITIPIYAEGICVNVRRHSPKKNQRIKTMSYKPGFGGIRLYPEENLKAEEILLCEGELDAILACQMGFTAISVTGGAGSWKDGWENLFQGKTVNLCYDIDQAGRDGAQRVAQILHSKAKQVKNVLLPITSPPNGDLTDYVVVYGHSFADLSGVIQDTEPFNPTAQMPATPLYGTPEEVSLNQASEAKMVGRMVRMKATVAGKDLSPYACPKKVQFTCPAGLKICRFCSIGQNGGKTELTIEPQSLEMLRLINCSEDQQRGFLRKAAGIYPGCPRFSVETKEFHTVEDVRLIPEISFSSDITAEYVVRQAFHVGHGISPNSTYEFEGLVAPNPKNQYVTFILPGAKPVKDNIQGFALTPKDIADLEVFQGEDVSAKMAEIAQDLTYNVTHIYQRENIIHVADLIYHSVMQFHFRGRKVKKGYTEALIIGDTRCGKSETIQQLIQHYRAGEISSGENASFAGLIGGMQQLGNRWAIIWGKIPLNDRRLFVIDEVSGMPVEDIGRMSGVRSSGIAEIIKVQTEKTFSRTRLIWIGNPRSPRPLGSYDSGVQAVKELIGRPEDVARFDLAIAVATNDVPLDVINQGVPQKVPHKYTSDLCHKLVLWAWSRTPDQIVFTPEAEEACLTLASELSKRYSAAVPLVEPAEQRIKIARLSVATAARLFSTDDGARILVKPSHVKFVISLLDRLYNSPALNYGAFSKVKFAEQTLRDENAVRSIIANLHEDIVEGLLNHQYLRLQDIEDLTGLDKPTVKPIVSQLVQNRALKHYNTTYVKSPAFIELLRKMQAELVQNKELRFTETPI